MVAGSVGGQVHAWGRPGPRPHRAPPSPVGRPTWQLHEANGHEDCKGLCLQEDGRPVSVHGSLLVQVLQDLWWQEEGRVDEEGGVVGVRVGRGGEGAVAELCRGLGTGGELRG